MKLPCMGKKISDETRAIFLFSDAQVDRALEIGLGGQEKTILFPFRLDLCVRLESLGLPYHTPWKYISDRDRMWVSAEGNRISRSWFEPFDHLLQKLGISLPALDIYTLLFFFEDCEFVHLVTQRFLDENPGITEVGFFSPEHDVMLLHPKNTEVHSALAAYLIEKRGMQALDLGLSSITESSGSLPSEGNKGHPLIEPPVVQDIPSGFDQHVGIFTAAFNDWKYYATLLYGKGFRITLFVATPPVAELKKVHNINFSCSQRNIYVPNSFTPNQQTMDIFDKAYKSFASLSRSDFVDKPYIFRNHRLQNHFKHFFYTRWPKLWRMIDEHIVALAANDPDEVLIPSVPVTESVLAFKVSKLMGIPVVLVPHSSNHFLSEPFNSAEATSLFMASHVPNGRSGDATLHVTGSPRLYIQSKGNVGLATRDQNCRKLICAKQSGRKVIFGITNGYVNSLFPFDNIAWCRLLETVFRVPDHLKEKVLVVIKPRVPWDCRELFELYQKVFSAEKSVLILPGETDFREVVSLSDVALGLGAWTTGFIDVLDLKKPLLMVENSPNFFFGERDRLGDFPDETMLSIASEQELWSTIEKILFDSEFASKLVALQQEQFRKSFPREDVPERVNEMIRSVSRDRDQRFTEIFGLLANYRNRLEELEQDKYALQERVRKLNANLHEKDSFIKEMRESRSWRLTKPLRTVTDGMRRVVKSLYFFQERSVASAIRAQRND